MYVWITQTVWHQTSGRHVCLCGEEQCTHIQYMSPPAEHKVEQATNKNAHIPVVVNAPPNLIRVEGQCFHLYRFSSGHHQTCMPLQFCCTRNILHYNNCFGLTGGSTGATSGVGRIHPLASMNFCTELMGSPSNSCWEQSGGPAGKLTHHKHIGYCSVI